MYIYIYTYISEQDLQSLGDGASWFEKTHADLER